MGSMSSYSSPKTSLYSSFNSSPKSSSYESSKVYAFSESPKSSSSASSIVSSSEVETKKVTKRVDNGIVRETSPKSSLNDFRDLLTSYLELEEQIEVANMTLNRLNAEKRVLEEKIANDPKFETFSEMFNSIKGAKK